MLKFIRYCQDGFKVHLNQQTFIAMIVRTISKWQSFCIMPKYSMGMLNEYLTQKQAKKQEAQFKKEMEYLANKPSFTLMDYKQRVEDQLNKMKSQFKAKISNDNVEQQKNLQNQNKVMNCLFQQELNLEKKLKYQQKVQIAMVTQMQVEYLTKVFGKFEEYRSMHRVLRELRQNNQPLPQNVKQLQQLYAMNASARSSNKKFKYMQYKNHTQAQKVRHMKKTYDHGYFL